MDYPKSVPNVGLINGKFVDENVGTGQPGSLIPSAWGSAVTDEILAVITGAGLVPNEAILNQLNAAINAKISSAATAFATQVEAEAGVVTTKAMSPLRVFQAIAKVVTQATESTFGWLKIATQATVNAGTDDAAAVTSKKLKAWFAATFSQATASVAGLVKIATNSLISAGTDDSTCVTPLGLKSAYGLGDSTLITNLDTAEVGYFYAVAGATGNPDTGICIGETRGGSGTASKTQRVIGTVSGYTYTRVFAGGAWRPWSTGIDSANQLGGTLQAWQIVTRAVNTTYTNSTGKTIFMAATLVNVTNGSGYLQVDGVKIANLGSSSSSAQSSSVFCVVPNGSTYGTVGVSSVTTWSELR